jgi:hypothetical protein
MQNLKKELANLKRYSVSPEFDFRMRSCIRSEYEKLRNPFYLLKIFIYENFSKLVAVPVVTALVIVSIVFYNNSNERQTAAVFNDMLNSAIDSHNGVELIPQDESSVVEEVNYVLETVKPSEVERGVFLNAPEGTVPATPNPNELTLISF